MRLNLEFLVVGLGLCLGSACSSSTAPAPADGGDEGGSTDTANASDETPPLVDAFVFEPSGPKRVTISFTTDEPALAVLELGRGPELDTVLDVSTDYATSHSIAVDDIEYGVEYGARVVCEDEAGNTMTSELQLFALSDTFPPALFDVAIVQDTDDGVTVTWRTDEPATSTVEFGATDQLGEATVSSELATEHRLAIAGLAPGTWHFRVTSSDGAGNSTSSEAEVFPLEDRLAPVFIEVAAEPVFPDAMRLRWRTDEPASAVVEYGPDDAYGTSVAASALADEHVMDVTGLAPGTTLHYRVVSTDASGNTGSSDSGTFTLDDKVPPVVSNVTLLDGSPDSMTVRWDTDEPANARVEWGLTSSYGGVVEDLSTYQTAHALTLTGLVAGATYHFRVSSEDPDGNLTVGSDSTFEIPDDFPPVISDVQAVVLWPGLAVVVWNTDEPASSVVFYGPTVDYGSIAVGVPELVEEHVVILTGLVVGTTYHYQVISTDKSGNSAASDDGEFLAVDEVPPVVSNLKTTQVSQTTALVEWETDEPAIYLLQWGPTTAFGQSAVEAEDYATEHAVLIDGLDQGSWVAQVVSADAQGNLAVAPNLFFEMDDVTAPLVGPVQTTTEWNEATFAFGTSESTYARVDYGTTAAYGQTAFALGGPDTQHLIRVDGLSPETTYHFSVVVGDLAGNEGSTPDDTFVTEEAPGDVELKGTLITWYPLELTVAGPVAHEADDAPNPFLDYRFVVLFTGPSGQQYEVPGFFDGDGDGGASGDAWRARFSPDEPGTWDYELLFHEGNNIAIDLDLGAGAPLAPHGITGEFDVSPVDPAGEGFLKWGRLEYVGGHYLKFRDGPYFLKGGTNSPENLLAYRGIDNTHDQPGGVWTGLSNGVHRYSPHFADWEAGDPWFVSETTGYNSKGVIGAINYLASKHVNSIYFLPMNLGGDGREVCPFIGFQDNGYDTTHYDISKLAQWNQIFGHAIRKGMLLHFVLAETESGNEQWLDNGGLGVQRKLFFRELSARFGHHLAIKWNLSEENDYSKFLLESFADYLDAVDPYDHQVAFHTKMLSSSGWYGDYEEVLGDPRFSSCSLQTLPDDAGGIVQKWLEDSAASGHPWVIDMDEIGPGGTGLTESNQSGLRKRSLYDTYFSGGNIEWYLGFHDPPMGGDLNVEDLRTREDMWNYTWYARKFLQSLPFWEMTPRDELVTGEGQNNGGAEVFAKFDEVYAVYLPDTTDTGTIDLRETSSVTFERRWYDPRTGNYVGAPTQVEGDQLVDNGPSPSSGTGLDWVVVYKRL